ncbi:MAG: YjjG family noncanonical pyrimidine nucleotidase [Rickettsiales bacterium]
MPYDIFFFDLDDTLLDWGATERSAFTHTMADLGVGADDPEFYAFYQRENEGLWKQFEQGLVTKEHLKVERFRLLFAAHKIDLDPATASLRYVDRLPQTVVLIDHAAEICEWLSGKGELGIVTNGIHAVQSQRIRNSAIAPYISFICDSESCGFAKPDVRFFEHARTLPKRFNKASSIVIGDRLEADILGARNFGVDSCWYNPLQLPSPAELAPTHEISHLSDLRRIIE